MSETKDTDLWWSRAEIVWRPEVSPATMEVRVEGPFEEYASIILRERLPGALDEIMQGTGLLILEVDAAQHVDGPAGTGTSFEQGEIRIATENLTTVFVPEELRALLDREVAAAIVQGDEQAKQDGERALEFLERLRQES